MMAFGAAPFLAVVTGMSDCADPPTAASGIPDFGTFQVVGTGLISGYVDPPVAV